MEDKSKKEFFDGLSVFVLCSQSAKAFSKLRS